MRLVMMGTGPFAVPTFRALYDTQHQLLALFTRPARPVHGRKSQEPVNPMRALAEERGTTVLDPESINTPDARQALAALAPDLLVVADYGQILSNETLAISRLGGINLHASLLPRYRGAAPINWAMYHGESETGVTVIHMTPKLDAGPCIAQEATPIGPTETAVDLEARLSAMGVPLVLRSIEQLESGTTTPIVQDQALATRAPRLKKTDGAIDWKRPAQAIEHQLRALEPWPRSYTHWHRPGHEPLRLIVDKAAVVPLASPKAPGEVVTADGGRLVIAAGEGALELLRVQPSGKRVLDSAEFLRGYPVLPGQTFGHAEE